MYSNLLDLLREMLVFWLQTAVDPPPSWEAVIEALRSPLVNEHKIAAQLESKYCAPVKRMKEESSSHTENQEGIVITTYFRFSLQLPCPPLTVDKKLAKFCIGPNFHTFCLLPPTWHAHLL